MYKCDGTMLTSRYARKEGAVLQTEPGVASQHHPSMYACDNTAQEAGRSEFAEILDLLPKETWGIWTSVM
jgi:hypothetical protein